MAYIIAVAGKGGVGKTTVAAFLIRYLVKKGGPVLAVDADPNANLNLLLGFEYSETVSDIREEAKNFSDPSFSKTQFFNMRLEEIISEGNGVDLLVMGRPEGPGCYCAVNNLLREHLSRLSKSYRFVVIDNEAGMEHLSRRTANEVDKLLLVTDGTRVGVRAAIDAWHTAKKAHLKIKDVGLVVNKLKGELRPGLMEEIKKSGLNISMYLPYNEGIENASEEGREITDTLPEAADFQFLLDKPQGV